VRSYQRSWLAVQLFASLCLQGRPGTFSCLIYAFQLMRFALAMCPWSKEPSHLPMSSTRAAPSRSIPIHGGRILGLLLKGVGLATHDMLGQGEIKLTIFCAIARGPTHERTPSDRPGPLSLLRRRAPPPLPRGHRLLTRRHPAGLHPPDTK
jgi:hypothetical protein